MNNVIEGGIHLLSPEEIRATLVKSKKDRGPIYALFAVSLLTLSAFFYCCKVMNKFETINALEGFYFIQFVQLVCISFYIFLLVRKNKDSSRDSVSRASEMTFCDESGSNKTDVMYILYVRPRYRKAIFLATILVSLGWAMLQISIS